MSERHEFRAGDLVPEWLMRVTPADAGCRITFEVDVVVEGEPGRYLVRPVSEFGQTVIRVSEPTVPVAIEGLGFIVWNMPTEMGHFQLTSP